MSQLQAAVVNLHEAAVDLLEAVEWGELSEDQVVAVLKAAARRIRARNYSDVEQLLALDRSN